MDKRSYMPFSIYFVCTVFIGYSAIQIKSKAWWCWFTYEWGGEQGSIKLHQLGVWIQRTLKWVNAFINSIPIPKHTLNKPKTCVNILCQTYWVAKTKVKRTKNDISIIEGITKNITFKFILFTPEKKEILGRRLWHVDLASWDDGNKINFWFR